MNDQFQLWLTPPMLTAALSFYFRRKLSIGFSWPLLLQSVLIIAAGLIGLFVGPKPLWAAITWILFFIFLILPNLYLRQCEHYYSSLNVNGLKAVAKKIPFFYWGKLGRFWRDVYCGYAAFMSADEEAGNTILARWKSEKLPPYFKEQLDVTELSAFGLLWQWDKIIAIFDSIPPEKRTASLCLQASRAFAETGQYELASQCMRATNLPNQRMSARSLALTFLQYFALVGAEDHTRQIIDKLTRDKNPPPKITTDVWFARCLIVRGRRAEAIELLQKSLTALRDGTAGGLDPSVWIPRLERQVALANQPSRNEESDDTKASKEKNIELIWQNYQDALAVQQVILPRRSSIAVNVLLLAVLTGYIFSGAVDLVDSAPVKELFGANSFLAVYAAQQGLHFLQQFYLEKTLTFSGQYYRLLSYMFLHGNFSHLLLNAVGLVWFGRIAAAIYGETRFLVIFFLSGIVGGLAQLWFTDVPAVGASGAIFGIFAAVVVAIFRLKDILPEQMRKKELRWMVIMTVAQIGLDRVIPRVAGLVHLGGIVTGLVLGYLLLPKQPDKLVQKSGKKAD